MPLQDRDEDRCLTCATQPNHLDAILPITYALRGAPVYRQLLQYKNARILHRDAHLLQLGTHAVIGVAGILTRFLAAHEPCLAAAAGSDRFDLVTTVPSGVPERDASHPNLRAIAAWSAPICDRYRRLLRPTGAGRWGRAFDPCRYEANASARGRSILLIEDLWVTGGHAQSAAYALRAAGATTVALVTIGCYLRPDWPAGAATTCAARLAQLPPFDWSTCAVHESGLPSARGD